MGSLSILDRCASNQSHLDVVRVDLVPGQHVEGAVVGATQEDAPARIVPANRYREGDGQGREVARHNTLGIFYKGQLKKSGQFISYKR